LDCSLKYADTDDRHTVPRVRCKWKIRLFGHAGQPAGPGVWSVQSLFPGGAIVADSKNRLVGKNYTTPDLVAKVTGKAKYAEDYRADGMLFTKLLLSPMPHARATRIDASKALAMPGVKAILTVDDLPAVVAGANLGEGIIASTLSERGLTMEPLYEGEPVLAVAAVDELTAAEAVEKILIEYEPLPFAVDPVESLKPDSPNARSQGNVWVRPAAPAPAPG